jgi:phosphate:Na+ symporter
MSLGGIVGVASIGVLASSGGTSVSRKIAALFLGITLLVILPVMLASPLLLELIEDRFNLPVESYFEKITWIHTAASILTAIVASALSGVASRFPGARDERGGVVPQPCASYLDTRIINTPTLAIEQARKEIARMISVTLFMYSDLRGIISSFDSRRAAAIRQHEDVLDALTHEITSFLALLAHSSSNPETSYEIPGLLQTVTDLEHIGDRTVEILDCIIERKEANLYFSNAAMDDLKRLTDLVGNLLGQIQIATEAEENFGQEELHSRKNEARAIFEKIKQAHYERICGGVCSPRTAMIYNEITDSFIRITELCWNIMAVQGRKVA